MPKFKMIICVDTHQLLKLRNEFNELEAKEDGTEFKEEKPEDLPIDEIIFLIEQEMGWVHSSGISVQSVEPLTEGE